MIPPHLLRLGKIILLWGLSLCYNQPCLTWAAQASPPPFVSLSFWLHSCPPLPYRDFRPPKEARGGLCLCLFSLSISPELERFENSRALRGLEGGGRREGVRMPVVGIGSSSPSWTVEPQCGVPVHILKHHKCVLLTRFVLFVSLLLLLLLTSASSSSYFWVTYLCLFFFLVPLTSLDWSFSRQCSSKQMSQAGLTLLYSHPASPHLSSLCRPSQQTALPRREVNKTPLHPPLSFFSIGVWESCKPNMSFVRKEEMFNQTLFICSQSKMCIERHCFKECSAELVAALSVYVCISV